MSRPTATIRHRASLRRRSQVVVTVTPNDGRFAEEFLLGERELVRFAWAVLADYEPDEAAAAGLAAAQAATAAAAIPRGSRGTRPGRAAPIEPGGLLHELLAEIAAAPGPLLLRDLCAAPREGLTKDQVRKRVDKLIRRRLVARVKAQDAADPRAPAVACSGAGRAILARLDAALNGAAAEARAA